MNNITQYHTTSTSWRYVFNKENQCRQMYKLKKIIKRQLEISNKNEENNYKNKKQMIRLK